MADLTGGLDSGSRASISGDYERLCEACSVVKASVPLSVADILSLVICSVDEMSKASILKVHVGALELTVSSNNICVGLLQSQLVSKT